MNSFPDAEIVFRQTSGLIVSPMTPARPAWVVFECTEEDYEIAGPWDCIAFSVQIETLSATAPGRVARLPALKKGGLRDRSFWVPDAGQIPALDYDLTDFAPVQFMLLAPVVDDPESPWFERSRCAFSFEDAQRLRECLVAGGDE